MLDGFRKSLQPQNNKMMFMMDGDIHANEEVDTGQLIAIVLPVIEYTFRN